jgi:hypothetical protein
VCSPPRAGSDPRHAKHRSRDSKYPACTLECDRAPADCADIDVFLSTGCAKDCNAADAARARALMVSFFGGCTVGVRTSVRADDDDSRTDDRAETEGRSDGRREGGREGERAQQEQRPLPTAWADLARPSSAADLPEYMRKLLERDESSGCAAPLRYKGRCGTLGQVRC